MLRLSAAVALRYPARPRLLSGGFALWLIGYALGMILFALVPASLIGWIIMPIGTAITFWIAFKKVKGDIMQY